MAINKPRIAGLPASERRRIKTQPFSPYPVDPNLTYQFLEPGNPTPQSGGPTLPSWEGQMYFKIFTDPINARLRRAAIYVAVDVNGTLGWKQVVNGATINGYTGKAFDPIYDS